MFALQSDIAYRQLYLPCGKFLSEAVGDGASASRKNESNVCLAASYFLAFHIGESERMKRKRRSKEEIRLIGDYYEPNEIY